MICIGMSSGSVEKIRSLFLELMAISLPLNANPNMNSWVSLF